MFAVNVVLIYLSCGLLFSIPFLTRWITTVDEAAKGTSWQFRLMLIPGTVVFWPVLAKKFLKGKPTKP